MGAAICEIKKKIITIICVITRVPALDVKERKEKLLRESVKAFHCISEAACIAEWSCAVESVKVCGGGSLRMSRERLVLMLSVAQLGLDFRK